MTKPWKLKTNSSNILLVLITLILVKAEWANGRNDETWNQDNSIDGEDSQSPDDQKPNDHVQIYVGNDEIAQYLFHSTSANGSHVLENMNKCLRIFQLLTCLKMLLLETINNVTRVLERPDITETDLYFLNGLIAFKVKNDTNGSPANSGEGDGSNLDEEISLKVLKMFRNRSLRVNLLPKLKIDVEPTFERNVTDFICFNYKLHRESEDDTSVGLEEGRRKKRKGGGGGNMFMLIPPLIMLGFMPFTLASLKAMVMNAVMMNMMALNGAIFMTIRNLVFGPRPGANVQYVNYGYSKNRQTQKRKPSLIIHSPAAFVKQPNYRKKPSYQSHGSGHHKYHSSNFESSYSSIPHSAGENYQNHIDYDYDYEGDDYTPGHEIGYNEGYGHDQKRRKQTIQRRVDDKNENAIQGASGYKTINDVRHNSHNINNKVNAYQRTPTTLKPEVRSQSKNQTPNSSYNSGISSPSRGYFHPDNLRPNTLKTNYYNSKRYSGTDNTYKSHSFGFSKKEFKPSPQWDPVIPDHSFDVNSNSNKLVKSETFNNHNYGNV